MRMWALALAFSIVGASAGAQGINCDALRGTNLPYQLTIGATGSGGGPTFSAQYYRRANGWFRLLVRWSGGPDVVVSEGRYGLVTRTAGTQILIEGVPPDRDPFADRQDFSYTQVVRPPAGPPQTDEYTARFRGEEAMTVSGCSFRVVIWQIERLVQAPRPGQEAFSIVTFWYAPELGSSLRLRSGIGEPNPYDLTAASIATRFDPFE